MSEFILRGITDYTLGVDVIPKVLFTDEKDLGIVREIHGEDWHNIGDQRWKPAKFVFKVRKEFLSTLLRDNYVEELKSAVENCYEIRYCDIRLPVSEGYLVEELGVSRGVARLELVFIANRDKYRMLFLDAILLESNTIRLQDSWRLSDIRTG